MWEYAWECAHEHLESVLDSIYSWESTIECNWERSWEHACKYTCEFCCWYTSEHTWSALGSIFRAYFRVYSQAGWEYVIQWNLECTSDRAQECAWENLERIVGSVQWSVFYSIVECSMMYSIKCTESYVYHSNQVNAQVHRSSYCHASNILLITMPETASHWVMSHVLSFFPVYLSNQESLQYIHSQSPSPPLLSPYFCAPPSPCWLPLPM